MIFTIILYLQVWRFSNPLKLVQEQQRLLVNMRITSPSPPEHVGVQFSVLTKSEMQHKDLQFVYISDSGGKHGWSEQL